MPKVYAVTETGQHNISSALDFGEIEVLLPNNVQVSFSVAPTVARVQRRLEKFTDDDYLLFIGIYGDQHCERRSSKPKPRQVQVLEMG